MIAAVSPAKLRKAQRLAHLLAAAGLLGYVYAPLETELRDVVRFAVFPALALTGIAMWQAPRIRRISRRSRRSPQWRGRSHPQQEEGMDGCNSASSMST